MNLLSSWICISSVSYPRPWGFVLEVVWDPPLVVHFVSISQLFRYDERVTAMVVMVHNSGQALKIQGWEICYLQIDIHYFLRYRISPYLIYLYISFMMLLLNSCLFPKFMGWIVLIYLRKEQHHLKWHSFLHEEFNYLLVIVTYFIF